MVERLVRWVRGVLRIRRADDTWRDIPMVRLAVLGAVGLTIVILLGLVYKGVKGVGVKEGVAMCTAEYEPKLKDLRVRVTTLENEKAAAKAEAMAERISGQEKVARISEEFLATRARATELEKDLKNALGKVASSSRACLSGRAVRVLNATGAPTSGTGEAGARQPGVDASPATTPTDRSGSEGAASERAVAEALLTARSRYEQCRSLAHNLQDAVAVMTGQAVLE